MEFFDSLIKRALENTQGLSEINYDYNPDNAWTDVGVNQVILQKHSAFELKGTGFNLITSSPVKENGALKYTIKHFSVKPLWFIFP